MFENINWPVPPSAEVLIYCAVIAAATAVITAACFGPFLAVFSERLAGIRKRGFYTKLAQQIARMNLALAVTALAAFGAGTAFVASNTPTILAFPYFLPLSIASGAAVLSTLLIGIYAVILPKKSTPSSLGVGLGLLAGTLSIATLLLATGIVQRFAHTMPDIDPALPWQDQLVQFFLIPSDSFIWPLLGESVPLGFAFAAAFATLWLLIMRDREDYGRDYYAFALRNCAGWALGATLVALLVGAAVFFQGRAVMLPELSQLPSLLLDVLAVILPLLSCLLWLLVVRSEHPMRRKISVVFAMVFLYAGLVAQVLLFAKFTLTP